MKKLLFVLPILLGPTKTILGACIFLVEAIEFKSNAITFSYKINNTKL
jgi:hypothetical protein